MTDHLSPDERSRLMSRIRGKDTRPERLVRLVAHRLGYRFRLHRKDLPGTPDLVFPRYHKVIFVHGCFWHRHDGCPKTTLPKTLVEQRLVDLRLARTEYWKAKQNHNAARDEQTIAKLLELGWYFLAIWECQTRNKAEVDQAITEFLHKP